MNSGALRQTLQATADVLITADDLDALRALQTAQDAIDAAKAQLLARANETKAFELEGSSSLNSWSRLHLRLSPRDTKALVAAQSSMRDLPAVAEAAAEGRIRLGHLKSFTYGLRHVGRDVVQQAETWLLDVAHTCEPSDLHTVIRSLREAVHPEELDQAWADGMDKQDISLNPVPGGWHLTGFLGLTIGSKFRTVLNSAAKPTDANDHRTGAERRIDGFETLLDRILESGLPTDQGIRPHLSVMVDADTLITTLNSPPHTRPTFGQPAELVGYGSIGPELLNYLGCLSDLTPILTNGSLPQANVLNVGRTRRLATLRQRRAIIARQLGECAAPGCRNTHLEIHHTIWWTNHGTTDLDLMVGLCSRCHHLIHRHHLNVTATGHGTFTFNGRDQRPTKQAYRERITLRREAWRIRRVGLNIEHRKRQSQQPTPVMRR